MRCLVAGYEERRRQRQRWRCCGGVLQVPAAVHAHADGVLDGGGGGRRGRLRAVARPVQIPEPAQDEAAGVPAARAQRQRTVHNRQRAAGRPRPAKRLQIHGVGAQLQRGHRVQRRGGYRR